MPDVSYVIRIVGGGGGVGKGKEKEKEKNVTGLGSEILSSAKNYGMGIVKQFTGIGTKASYLAPVTIAATALNKLDNLRISMVGVTTGNYTYQSYQEAVKEIVTHPISYLFGFWERAETKVKNEAQLSLDSFTTYQRNIRAGSMGNRVPRKQ